MKTIYNISLSSVFLLLLLPALLRGQIVFEDDFENGSGDWFPDNGAWQIGEPATTNPVPFSGSNLAGTVLDGNYPQDANTRLISPPISLPVTANDEILKLKFWQWFQMDSWTEGNLQISVNNGAWEIISNNFDDNGGAWTQYFADLTAYQGLNIRLGFYFDSESLTPELGWYIDDVVIVQEQILGLPFQGFESGQRDWSADNGSWEIGALQGSPIPYEGSQCAGTVLSGTYPRDANTRLVSPEVLLPNVTGNNLIKLKFWQWFQMDSWTEGNLQISVNGGPWQIISNSFNDSGGTWTQFYADLTAYQGEKIRLGFYFYSESLTPTTGWYIDNVEIIQEPTLADSLQGFELGQLDWYADNGSWEIGTPQGSPIAYEGTQCAGTVLDGNYPQDANTRLVSPKVEFSSIINQQLRFAHWFQMDSWTEGNIQMSINGGTWETISGPFNDNSGGWTNFIVPLNGLAQPEDTVQVAFYFESESLTPDLGWYVDNIEFASYSSQPEICNNNIDDDGDDLIDCEDPDCTPTILTVNGTNPTPPDLDNGQIIIQAFGQNLEYSIDGGDSFQSNNIFNNLLEGSYTIIVQNTQGGCSIEYENNPVVLGDVNDPCVSPSFSWVTEPQWYCEPTSITLIGTNAHPDYSYQLFKDDIEVGNPNLGIGGALTFGEIFLNTTSIFSVRAILIEDPSCSFDFTDAELEIKVEGLDLTILDVKAESGTDNNGRINFCVKNGTPPYTVTYEPDRGTILSSLDPDCVESYVIDGLKAGFYKINLSDDVGCEGNLIVEVPNPDKRRIGFPEKPLLTPNNDGSNDELIYDGLFKDPELNELIIYDRFGSIIFREKPYGNNWDGTYNGNPVPDGTYFYTLYVFGEREDVYTGFITLIR